MAALEQSSPQAAATIRQDLAAPATDRGGPKRPQRPIFLRDRRAAVTHLAAWIIVGTIVLVLIIAAGWVIQACDVACAPPEGC